MANVQTEEGRALRVDSPPRSPAPHGRHAEGIDPRCIGVAGPTCKDAQGRGETGSAAHASVQGNAPGPRGNGRDGASAQREEKITPIGVALRAALDRVREIRREVPSCDCCCSGELDVISDALQGLESDLEYALRAAGAGGGVEAASRGRSLDARAGFAASPGGLDAPAPNDRYEITDAGRAAITTPAEAIAAADQLIAELEAERKRDNREELDYSEREVEVDSLGADEVWS
jgi:hypothetical protein